MVKLIVWQQLLGDGPIVGVSQEEISEAIAIPMRTLKDSIARLRGSNLLWTLGLTYRRPLLYYAPTCALRRIDFAARYGNVAFTKKLECLFASQTSPVCLDAADFSECTCLRQMLVNSGANPAAVHSAISRNLSGVDQQSMEMEGFLFALMGDLFDLNSLHEAEVPGIVRVFDNTVSDTFDITWHRRKPQKARRSLDAVPTRRPRRIRRVRPIPSLRGYRVRRTDSHRPTRSD